ncbi:MAG: Hsp33 family molecular chaperone HslO [Oligoflexia bacterium]|nr:Hsp33 family molecular chaperone HslO [Oligoflexia bacterium]
MSAIRTGRLVRALACDRKVRVLAVVADGPARDLVSHHKLTAGAAVLASEGLVAAVLLSNQVKGEERITLDVQGERPRFALSVDVWGDGPLRARFTPANLAQTDRFSGYLSAIRSLDGKELYRGIAKIQDETFEQALSRYLTSSEQVDGRVRIQARLDKDGSPRFAAGLLVERFPDTDPEEFAAIFDQPLKGDFAALMTGFAFGQLAGQPVDVLEARDLEFRCTCSLQRVTRMLRTLGPTELRDMLEKDGGAEITCHFCNQRYDISADQLRALIAADDGGE